VVAAGGDGTVSDVINEMPPEIPFAALPTGNENLFAREFGFTRDALRLAQWIAKGGTRQIDLGRSGGRLFSVMLSAGLDADVVHRLVAWRRQGTALRRVRRLSYAKPIVATLRSYAYRPITLEADGSSVVGTHAFVFNLPQYGFQLPFARHASAEDGMLDWLVFERAGLGAVLSYFWSLIRLKHLARPDVRHGRGRRIRISGTAPVPVQMDGEAAGTTPVDVQVAPRALRVIVGT
jgi:diacylglycerol kinase family enzyme